MRPQQQALRFDLRSFVTSHSHRLP
jgi:hypothetical protein